MAVTTKPYRILHVRFGRRIIVLVNLLAYQIMASLPQVPGRDRSSCKARALLVTVVTSTDKLR
jgi:hypothetical protein